LKYRPCGAQFKNHPTVSFPEVIEHSPVYSLYRSERPNDGNLYCQSDIFGCSNHFIASFTRETASRIYHIDRGGVDHHDMCLPIDDDELEIRSMEGPKAGTDQCAARFGINET
jgi:hypothetical protein